MKFFAILWCHNNVIVTYVYLICWITYTHIFSEIIEVFIAIGIESKAERSVYNESCNEREDRWHCYLVTFCLLQICIKYKVVFRYFYA